MQNDVPQGLSSAIMTTNLREAERFLSHEDSDCGIANVNVEHLVLKLVVRLVVKKKREEESLAQILEGLHERQTNTINYSTELPLAQGIKFDFLIKFIYFITTGLFSALDSSQAV